MQVRIFDIDDTLCEDGGKLDDSTIQTLLGLKRRGERIWFASARHWVTTTEALQDPHLYDSAVIATENGSCIHQNAALIEDHYLGSLEREAIAETVVQCRSQLRLLDYWLNGKLQTVSHSIPCGTSDDPHREYLSIEDALRHIATETIHMVHYLLGDEEGHWMPASITKAQIFRYVPSDANVFLYGNGSNDLPIFNHKSHASCVRHAVGPNVDLRRAADRCFSTREDLLAHLRTI